MFTNHKTKFLITFLLSLFLVLSLVGCSSKQTPQSNSTNEPTIQAEKPISLEGKQIEMIIPYSAGGGYDNYARIMSPYLEKETGATVIIRNIDGGGGIVGTNTLYHADPNAPNKINLGLLNGQGIIQSVLLNQKGVEFDLSKFNWLGLVASQARILELSPRSKYKSVNDLLEAQKNNQQMFFGSAGVGSPEFVNLAIIKNILGLNNAKMIAGYPGKNEVRTALLRGEIDATEGTYESAFALIKSGEMIAALQLGAKRYEKLPDVPLLSEIKKVNDKDLELLKIQQALSDAGRVLAAPPGLSNNMVLYLQEKAKNVLTNKEMLAKGEAQGLEFSYMSGEEIGKVIKNVANLSPDAKSRFVKVIEESGK